MKQRNVVLLGIGHTNAHVVKQWASDPIPNCKLICISKFATSTYSGMLPGTLGQQFREDEMRIDLEPLVRRAKAELILADASALDLQAGEIQFEDHDSIRFDALSVGIGSIPSGWDDHRDAPSLVPIKPMQTFLQRLESRIESVECSREQRLAGAIRIAVVGGGVAGVEIALCLLQHLHRRSPSSAARVAIFTSGSHVADGMTP